MDERKRQSKQAPLLERKSADMAPCLSQGPVWALLLALQLLTVAGSFAAERYGGEFLRLGIGAAVVGRGRTGVLLADPGCMAWWNPALLSGGAGDHLAFQHSERFDGQLGQDYLSWAGGLGELRASCYLLRQAVDDIPLSSRLEGGDSFEDGGVPLVHARETAADWILGAAFGRPLARDLDLGLALKLLHRDLAGLRGTGLGLDAGLRYTHTPSLSFGLATRDLLGNLVFWNDGETGYVLPEVSAGAAWTPDLPAINSRLMLEADLRAELEGAVPDARGRYRRAWVDLGLELLVLERLALRAGMADGRLAAGAGLRFGRFRADYAYRPHEELGAGHLVWFGAELPR